MIVLAGGTGNLGGLMMGALKRRGAEVRALVRQRNEKSAALERAGAQIVEANFRSPESLARACEGASCVVSTLAGLRDVLVDNQLRLVDAAIAAKVPRFIPSDYASDFMDVPAGRNRNFDIHREFANAVAGKPIKVTTVLNGCFMEMLIGPAPFLVFPIRRAVYWGSADQKMDFTAMEDVADFTAAAALDDSTPPVLKIAGAECSPRDLAEIASEVTGKRFRTLRAGSTNGLGTLIKMMRRLIGGEDQLFPPWQGMMYSRDMLEGLGKLTRLDNARYPDVKWTSVAQMLRRRKA